MTNDERNPNDEARAKLNAAASVLMFDRSFIHSCPFVSIRGKT